jgi:hypothetical protein
MASNDEPITTSGVAMGKKMTRFEVDRPRNECRTRANAIKVPSSVARIVAVMLIPKLSFSDSHRPAGSQMVDQLFQVKGVELGRCRTTRRLVEGQGDDVADRHERVQQHADAQDQHEVV